MTLPTEYCPACWHTIGQRSARLVIRARYPRRARTHIYRLHLHCVEPFLLNEGLVVEGAKLMEPWSMRSHGLLATV